MKPIKLKRVVAPIKLDLQYFADGGDGGTGGARSEGGQGGGTGGSDNPDPEPITFKSQSEFDSEVDKRISKALQTAQAKWQTESQKAIEDARTEAERMAAMSAEEKAAAAKKKEEEVLAKREAEITRRELRATALETLAEKELPKELIDAVVITDADACTKSIEAIETAFRAAVEAGVNKRLAGSANIPGGSGNGSGASGKEVGATGKRLAEKNATKQQESKFFKN